VTRSRWSAIAAASLAVAVACAATPAVGAADAAGATDAARATAPAISQPVAATDVALAYVDAWNGSPARFEPLLAEEFVDRTALLPLDRALFAAHAAAWRAAVPDLRVTLLERTSAPGREVLRLRYDGTLADAALAPYSGKRIAIEQTERLTIAEGRISVRQAFADEWTLPAEWMFAAPPAVPFEPYEARTVARLEPGRFLESIAIAPDGRLYVSTGPDGGISIVEPDGRVTPFARIDVGPGGFMMCVAFDRDGALYASVNSANDSVRGVWLFAADGQPTRLAALPPGVVPNGLAIDARGNAYIADSFGGVIWQVPAGGGEPSAWLRHAWLTPRPLIGRYPGANGLQLADGALYVAVSDRALLLRIPIAADGAAGSPEIYASGLPADDFAIAADGSLYLTTHPFNSVVKLARDGRRSVVAGPAQGVIGPTAAAIAGDGSLYVVTDGGLFRPSPGEPIVPGVVRLVPGP
jgi:sugar lactone lactonase YvrE